MNKCTRCGEVNPAEIHTCTPQTKAQRLAAELDEEYMYCPDDITKEAAAELRRLDALNTELMGALNCICLKCRSNEWGTETPRKEILNWMHDYAAAALMKIEEKT